MTARRISAPITCASNEYVIEVCKAGTHRGFPPIRLLVTRDTPLGAVKAVLACSDAFYFMDMADTLNCAGWTLPSSSNARALGKLGVGPGAHLVVLWNA